jgi:probable phosphoglycerate mutase
MLEEGAPGPAELTRAMRELEGRFLFGVDGVSEVWLIRHADCYEGMVAAADPPLSPLGLDQADRLAARLGRLGIKALYASPTRRAGETAITIGPPVKVDERLVEIRDDPLEAERAQADIGELIDEAVATHGPGRVVMVGHGRSILALLCGVLRVEFGELRLLPYYTSVSVVKVLGERRMVATLCDISHLEGESTAW